MKKTRGTDTKKSNIPIIIMMWAFIILFSGMIYYIVDYSISNKQELIGNSYNGRAKILAQQNMRGTIYSKDGDVLVSSELSQEGKEIRNYKYGAMFAHVVGYATNGRMGIEDLANYYLINSNAPVSTKAKMDAQGLKYPGDSVYSTLDLNLQKVAYDALGQYRGAVVVSEPSTGKILAMVSKPDFDPAEVMYKWNDLINDSGNSSLLNRVTQGKYPPGSTFKIITAMEYIKEHPDDYSSYHYNCTGSITRGEDTIRCYHGMVHGSLTFKKAFAKSCNSAFADIGLSLDRNSFGYTLNSLLFNNVLPTKLPTSSSKLIVTDSTQDTDMIQIVIGQGLSNITPLQLNMITQSIANDGILMEPYVLDRVENSAGSIIKQFEPQSSGELIEPEIAKIMRSLMEDVVEEGTATKLKGASYYAGGKTGSAEFGVSGSGESHAWFTGYAGLNKDDENQLPDICLTIIIEEAGTGGDYAVPIAKRIFDAYYANK